MSVFVAIELEAPVRAQVEAVLDEHRAAVDAKWLRPDKLHLTLVFLGNTIPETSKLDALAATATPFSLELQGSGVFVTERAPAVLWLGVGGELERLHALQREAAASLGDEPRPYVPHVTLGRAHTPGAFDAVAAKLAAFQSARFTVRHLVLIESTHHVFRGLHRSPLRTPAI